MRPALVIGIDPGVKTGLAIWDRQQRKLVKVATLKIHDAMAIVQERRNSAEVFFEDARQRKFFTSDAKVAKYGAGVREGVGSVKRDCGIWQDFLTGLGIPFQAVKPAPGMTGWSKVYLRQISGYDGPSSEHARDAAALVVAR